MLARIGEPSRGATLGFLAPQSFFGFSNHIKSTLVERQKVTKVTQDRLLKLQKNVTFYIQIKNKITFVQGTKDKSNIAYNPTKIQGTYCSI